MNELHTGKLIKSYIKNNGIQIKWVTLQMNWHRNTIYGIFNRKWVDTDTLMRLSIILKHDFFADISKVYHEILYAE